MRRLARRRPAVGHDELPPFPTKRYDIVYADPPWYYYGSKIKDAAAAKHYPLMDQHELAKLPVRSIMNKRAALFLWCTGPRLNFAIDLIAQGVQQVQLGHHIEAGRLLCKLAVIQLMGQPFDERMCSEQEFRVRIRGLLRDLGAAAYAEHSGRGTATTQSDIEKLIAAIEAHEAEHGNLDLSMTSDLSAE